MIPIAVILMPVVFVMLGVDIVVWYSRRVRQQQRQVALLSAELANTSASRDACLRSLNIAIQENAKLRRGRPLVLNGRVYLAYRILPESIYMN